MNFIGVEEIDFAKGDGLVPVVAQEAATGRILMLAYANREALERTMDTGFAHYFSRSRGRLWRKGEDSGHVQHVKSVLVDCDGDSLVYVVEQTGPACHTGEESCFYRGVKVGKQKKTKAPDDKH
jgi:phosphoribosyl-AMP cyclohydrolase